MRLTAEGRVEDLSFLRELKKPAQGRVFAAGQEERAAVSWVGQVQILLRSHQAEVEN